MSPDVYVELSPDVYVELSALDTSKARGIDEICPHPLKEGATKLAVPLTTSQLLMVPFLLIGSAQTLHRFLRKAISILLATIGQSV